MCGGVRLGASGGRTGGLDWGSDWGVKLEGVDGGSDWGSDKVVGKISQVSLRFFDISSDVDVVHPTCLSVGKVNFGLDKVTSRSVKLTAKAITMS